MIQCICEKDIQTADELCEVVQDCKKDLKGVKIGKHHKIGGAGGKAILLVGKSKEFVSYENVLERKTHFGKLVHKAFFDEDSEEEEVFEVNEVLLDLQEKLNETELEELCQALAEKSKNRLDLNGIFMRTNDYSEEVKEAFDTYKFENRDITRAYGLLNAINVEFDVEKASWKTDVCGNVYRMTQNEIKVEFCPSSEICDDFKMGLVDRKELNKFIFCRNEYGDALFRKDGDKVILIVIIESRY